MSRLIFPAYFRPQVTILAFFTAFVVHGPALAFGLCGSISGLLTSTTPYDITCDVTVPIGQVLTLEPGVTFRFADGVSMTVDGTLSIPGDQPGDVLFTSGSPTPHTGSWAGITVTGNVSAKNFQLEYSQNGLSIWASSSSVTDAIFDQNNIPIQIAPNSYPGLRRLSLSQNSTLNGIRLLNGTWSTNGTLTYAGAGAPYVVTSDLFFTTGRLLTLEPGVTIKVDAGRLLYLAGLNASGTGAQPITITSLRDDSVDGDTSPSDATPPAHYDWSDLELSGTGILDHVNIGYGSSVKADSGITLTNSTLAYLNGLVLSAAGATVTDTTFDHDYVPVQVAAASYPVLRRLNVNENNTYLNGIQLLGGLWPGGGTLTDAGASYVISNSVSFASGQTLTLEPGVTIKVAAGQFLSLAGLNASGTAAHPITITSLRDDSVDGDTSPSDATPPAHYDWSDLALSGTGILDHVNIGYGSSVKADSGITLANSTLANLYGLVLNAAGATVTDTTFDHDNAPVQVAAASYPVLRRLNVNEDNTYLNGIQLLGGLWSSSGTLTDAGAPYVISSSVSFASGQTLTLEPGVTIKVAAGQFLSLAGLNAAGTGAQPITITSLRDDSVDGDTNPGEGLVYPAKSDWVGITFTSGALHLLSHVTVAYAGTALAFDGVQGNVENGRLIQNVIGMDYRNGGNAVVTKCAFVANNTSITVGPSALPDLGNVSDPDPSNDGLNTFVCDSTSINYSGTPTLKAQHNYWGAIPPDCATPDGVVGNVDTTQYLCFEAWPALTQLMVTPVAGTDYLELDWEDLAPSCGYRVFRSDQPNTGWVQYAGRLLDPTYTDRAITACDPNACAPDQRYCCILFYTILLGSG